MKITAVLQRAVNLAFRIEPVRGYRLAAIGFRADGATVHATNKTVRGPEAVRLWKTHAEVRLCKKLDCATTIFVARVLKNGEWGNARPCENCQRVLRAHRVRKAFYTIGPSEYGCLIF